MFFPSRQQATLRLVPLAVAVLVLAGCTRTSTGNALKDQSVTTASATASTSPAPPPGPAVGDVDALVRFTDPATEIVDAAALTTYVLPGMSGRGVECFEQTVDSDRVLAMAPGAGADHVAGLVVDCVNHRSLGGIIAMYAVGFRDDGADLYPTLADCASPALDEVTPDAVRAGLASILRARLDLPAPPTSPDIAVEFLDSHTDCFAATEPATSTPPGEPTVPSSPTVTADPPPVPDRTVRWDLLRVGDCILHVPDGEIVQVTTTSCDTPHESEVVGATLALSGTEEQECEVRFSDYTGLTVDDLGDFSLDYVVSTDTFFNPKLICLVSSPGVETTTGSIASS